MCKNYVLYMKMSDIEIFVRSKKLCNEQLKSKHNNKVVKLISSLIYCPNPQSLFIPTIMNVYNYNRNKCNICTIPLRFNNMYNEYNINIFTQKYKYTCKSCMQDLLLFSKTQVVLLCEPKIIYDLFLIKQTDIYLDLNLDVFYHIFKLMLII